MSRKKAFELRDREYTQKLLEKVSPVHTFPISISCLVNILRQSGPRQVAAETRLARERAERFGLAFTEPRMVRVTSVSFLFLPLPRSKPHALGQLPLSWHPAQLHSIFIKLT
jgi:hypothetical protein